MLENLVQEKTASIVESQGLGLTQEQIEELAQKVYELIKQELIEENARLGKLI